MGIVGTVGISGIAGIEGNGGSEGKLAICLIGRGRVGFGTVGMEGALGSAAALCSRWRAALTVSPPRRQRRHRNTARRINGFVRAMAETGYGPVDLPYCYPLLEDESNGGAWSRSVFMEQPGDVNAAALH